jgi:hypothetical protein
MRGVRGWGAALAAGALTFVAGVFGACLTPDDDNGVGCRADQTSEGCACPNGGKGLLVCDESRGWAECHCDETPCQPGVAFECACPGERTGLQICGADGRYGACLCEPAGVGGGGAGGAGPRPPGGRVLRETTTPIVDLFAVPAGAIIVRADGVELVDHEGKAVGSWVSPREVTAAAFDGGRLVVADRARLTTLATDLTPVGGGELLETCVSAVLVSGRRFVCGPAHEGSSRTFATYDALTGERLATSTPYDRGGLPMRRVPGTDDFVTVLGSYSPDDYFLYRVSGALVSYVNKAPYQGGLEAIGAYAFLGAPATHVVSPGGLLLSLRVPGCDGADNPPYDPCFVKDGNLGTLADAERFVALADNEPGLLAALVALGPAPDFGPECASGCAVQRVDLGARTVRSQKPYGLDIGRVIAAVHDASTSSLLLAYGLPGETYGPPSSYRLEALAYE